MNTSDVQPWDRSLPVPDLERALRRIMREHHCDRYRAHFALLEHLDERCTHLRRTPSYELRGAIGEMLIRTVLARIMPRVWAECRAAGWIDGEYQPLDLVAS